MNDFSDMNAAYAKYVPQKQPARSTAQLSRLARDVSLEIEAMAVIGK